MEDKNFSAEQSLQLIQGMINKARQDIIDRSKYFLLWGWLAIIGITGQFILKVLVKYHQHYYAWAVVFIGIVVNNYWAMKDSNKEKVKTYAGESLANLWLGMAISFFVLSILFIKIGWQYCYPFFIMMYGLGTFVSGRILKFKPFVVGGIAAWLLSMVSVQFYFDYQMLFAAAALLVSYIIPAYMLRIHQQKQHA